MSDTIKIEDLELNKFPPGFAIELGKREFILIKPSEVDKLISTAYGIEYNCVKQEVWNNDLHHLQIDGELHDLGLENFAVESLDMTLKKKKIHKFFTEQYMNFLAKLDMIPKGDYLVHVT